MSREACVYSETACSEHGQAGRNANVVPAEKTGAKWADRVLAARSSLQRREMFYLSVASASSRLLGIQLVFVSVIYGCVTNYPKTWCLKMTHIYYLVIAVGQESRHGLPVCLWLNVSHKVEIPRVAELQ